MQAVGFGATLTDFGWGSCPLLLVEDGESEQASLVPVVLFDFLLLDSLPELFALASRASESAQIHFPGFAYLQGLASPNGGEAFSIVVNEVAPIGKRVVLLLDESRHVDVARWLQS